MGGPTCFNCGGPHIMSECQEPIDHRRVAIRRNKFRQSQGSLKNVRYHEETSDPTSHCKPGFLSEPLREVLGLRPMDIPKHIYRMRQVGYPPGYRQDLLREHTGNVLKESGKGNYTLILIYLLTNLLF
jgi:zinc finger CCHC domain-containing protein 8